MLWAFINGIGSDQISKFDWAAKNESYKQNLNLFKVEYFNVDILNANNSLIKKKLIKELYDFEIEKLDQYYETNKNELLLNLNSLKPLESAKSKTHLTKFQEKAVQELVDSYLDFSISNNKNIIDF